MGLKVAVEGVTPIGDRLWGTRLAASEVERLGQPLEKRGALTVIGIQAARFDRGSSMLTLELENMVVLNQGDSENVLIVDLMGGVDSGERSEKRTEGGNLHRTEGAVGDAAFIRRCELELGPVKSSWMSRFLREVRKDFPGELREHKARKWVNYRDNFFAVVIQPRKGTLCFHIRGAPDQFHHGLLRMVQDRPSYSRFWVEKEEQLEDAIRIVLESGRRRL